ncbi:C4-dicarboxylate ABC transporter permease (plasmid) [Natronorubrum bangense]|uniref:C4-dicarboxylate ABC transporter permease n=2 Tax=Natronorubrum bangense TaxID=61858 RepID=A0A4D6HJY6_9EURY|nr:TRAP transporter fused permease subunit [Natronorubrum bangense]QCC53067.1 C4-dicarboxylate ABC transporter permease [Natronorubrum bangense]QCC56240.1 C4-dicarboxylate ABC transporter permease [Natronorubrum bangense]
MVTLNTDRNKRILESVLTYGSVLFWVMVLGWSYSQLMPRAQYGIVFLGAILLVYIVNEFIGVIEEEDRLSAVLLTISAAVVITTVVYLFTNYSALYEGARGIATDSALALALAFTLVIVYLTWRSFGMTFLVVLLAGIGYGLFGQYIGGILGHGGITSERMLRLLVLEVEGFFGSLNRLVAAWIAPFLLYAGLLKAYGAFDMILRLAVRSAKYISSGVAQTAVVASAVIGSVNGSQTANAGMTGSFTIPMMKESGVKPETAGGIESVASTAGQVLPPVMGAAAFIMVSVIGGSVTYVDVMLAGLIPAAILMVSIFAGVHYIAAPQIENPTMDDYFQGTKTTGEFIYEGLKYAIPLVILLYVLGVLQYTVMTGALWTAVAMIITGITFPIARALYEGESLTAKGREVLVHTRDGAREGAVVLAPVAIILAAINGVVDILLTTGVPTAISLALMDLSGGVLLLAAVMSMIICILLGLGMPTSAAYTIVALLVAPALTGQFLLPDFAAHYFVFYAAILAGLTPPIATCAAVACGIAGASFWKTVWEALKISAPLYVLPFAFIYHPELVSGAFDATAISAGALAMLGALTIIHGINYRFAFGRSVSTGARVVFFALGIIVMVYPDLLVQLGALAATAGLLVVQTIVGKPDPVGKLQALATGINGSSKEPIEAERP